MKQRIRFIALSVAVVLGAFPAVTLTCQWACAPDVAGHTHHSHHAAPSTPGLVSAELPCAHAEAAIDAISTLPVKAVPCVAVHAAAGVVASVDRAALSVTAGAPSPPGARSRSFALRI